MQKKKIKTIVILTVVLIILSLLAYGIIFLLNNYIIPNTRYNDAKKAIEAKDYTEAYALLSSLENHEKAEKLLQKFEYKLVSVKDSEGNPYELYKYDQDGNPLTYKIYTYELDSEKEEKHTYEYDEDGYKIKDISVISLNGKQISRDTTQFIYNDYGFCVKEKNVQGTTEYIYDNNDRVVCEKFSADLYSVTTLYEYENGLIKREKSYSSDIYNGDYIEEHFYNSSNQLIKKQKIYYDFYENTTTTSSLKYNDDSRLIEKQEPDKIYTYKYDEKGNCIEEICKKTDKSDISTFRFVYDEFGGITSKEIVTSDNTLKLSYEYKVFYNPKKKSLAGSEEVDGNNQTPILKDELLKIYSPKIEEYRSAFKLSQNEFLIKYPNDQSINASAFNKIRNDGNLVYALYDIDKNGVDELIIGIGDVIIDLYSVSKGKLLKLFKDCSFCKPNNIHILSNGIMLYEGTDSTYSGSFIKHYITKDKNENIIVNSAGSKYYNDRVKNNKKLKNYLSKEYYNKICKIMLKTSVKDELNWQKIK